MDDDTDHGLGSGKRKSSWMKMFGDLWKKKGHKAYVFLAKKYKAAFTGRRETEYAKSVRRKRERERQRNCFVSYPFEESKHLFSSSQRRRQREKGAENKRKGQKIRVKLGFSFISLNKCCPSWEIK
ncbi:unnamed protein product [Eruca vesicaria subsp. sativa]|uniref:Uncharacterized protein n=1 Tax=Eruca vesicaria subsp. sativa TaxID=29727 RepID=A0ABC8M0I6_ERUVS|nr:unnamed protein product [Eruca vesicaria subsp. sativa]